MRLIDADAVEYGSASTGEYVFEYVTKYQIDNAPTVDAVQVVRCKDCFLYGECRLAEFVGGDGYCSCGKEKR